MRRITPRYRYMNLEVLEPLARLWTLQELDVEWGYTVDKKTWRRIQELRAVLGLPALVTGMKGTGHLGF